MDNVINILSKIKIDFNHPKKSQILLYGIHKQELFEKYLSVLLPAMLGVLTVG